MARTVTPLTATSPPPVTGAAEPTAPRPRRLLLNLVAVVAVGAVVGCWTARQAAQRAVVRRLSAVMATCQTTGRISGAAWARLDPAERQAVCGALLAESAVDWDGSLDDGWLAAALLEILAHDSQTWRRARAARAVGDLASHTVVDEHSPGPAPPALRPALTALATAAEEDREPRVRTAAAAALLRLRPVARCYRLGPDAEPGF